MHAPTRLTPFALCSTPFALCFCIGLTLTACPKPQPGPIDDPKHCKVEDCGPKPGMPNKLCDDGVTMSGPGECVAKGGACAWEIIECPASPEPSSCGGIAGKPCPAGSTCVDDPSDDCDPKQGGADCIGICQKATACGGIAARPCPDGMLCVDDPNDDCDPANGGADCGGVCEKPTSCGGIAGLPCPEGTTCVDDPRDDCHPKKGGADCIGICQRS